MKTIKDRVDNFFKWVKGSELVELTDIDVSEDPVRPELDLEFRTSYGRKIYGLKYEDSIEGIICVAYMNEIPQTIRELDMLSRLANNTGTIAVAYTVWSRKRGAGRQIIEKFLDFIKDQNQITQLVTLSPLTPMATHFHISNGAKLLQINSETQNFEYQWRLIN
jgi:hypothetical protein|tara:strand:+ start:1504 stop:1995 length:492 start_codon:yes stop_codon:yes gene_type:complete